jgi:hypothetical protein
MDDDALLLEHKKDPGIPNDFPYKDQILAEVAEQRRLVSAPVIFHCVAMRSQVLKRMYARV